MEKITNMATHVPLLPVDSDSDDDVTQGHNQGHTRVKHKSKVVKQKSLKDNSAVNRTEIPTGDRHVRPSDSFKGEKQSKSGDKR